MQFAVQPQIFEFFPGMCLAVLVAHGLENAGENRALEALWRETWTQARAEGSVYGNAQSHPRVRIWRERLRAIGVSPKEFPSSIEALLRRALKGGEPFTINPLVDFYNTISLRHTVPVGAFDLDGIGGPFELRLTAPGDTFLSMDSDIPVDVPAGEVAYADGSTVLTRHFVWRQSRAGLIVPSTRSAFLVSEVLGEVGEGVAETVLGDLADGLRTYFDVRALTFLVHERQPEVDWES